MKHNITKMATGLMACTVVASLGSVMASAAPANSVYTARAAANQSSNTDKLEQIIDSQTDSSTKTSVESLFDTYKDMATAAETAEQALVAALKEYVIADYTTDGQLDVSKVQTAISSLTDSSAVTELTKLLDAYVKAAEEVVTPKAKLVNAMEKAGFEEDRTTTTSTGTTSSSVTDTASTAAKTSGSLSDRTPAELLQIINSQDDSTTKTNVKKLLTAYQTKEQAAEAAEQALAAALQKYGIEDCTTDGQLDVSKVQAEISNLRDSSAVTELKKLLDAYVKASEAVAAPKAELISAMEDAGFEEDSTTAASTAKTSVSTKTSGSLSDRTPAELLQIINSQDDSTTKTNVKKLLTAYQTKEQVAEAAEQALVAALKEYGIVDYTTDGQLDVSKVQTAISSLTDSSAVTELTKLLDAYVKADEAVTAPKTELVSAMEKAGYSCDQ